MQRQKLSLRDGATLALGLGLFATLSLITIGTSSIWFDEAFGAYLIRFDFAQIWHYTSLDVHPPLYYWLLKLWSMAFGTSDVALRSMSVLFGAVALVLAYLLMRRLFDRRAASYSLVILALSPMVIRYSQEMRMYTLVAAIALAATYVLVRATESNRRRDWIIYGILVSLGMWTHYFSALVWIAHWVWRGLMMYRPNMKVRSLITTVLSKNWLIAYGLAIGLYLPWLPFMLIQVVTVQAGGFWIPPIGPMTLTNFFTGVVFYLDQSAMNAWLTVLFAAVVAVLIYLGVRGYRTFDSMSRCGYALLLCVAFVPFLLLVISSLPPLRPSFIDRYLIPSTFAIALVIAVNLALAHKTITSRLWRGVAILLVMGSLAYGTTNVWHYGNFNKNSGTESGAKQLISAVHQRSLPGQPIIADSLWMFYDAVFYETSDHPLYFIDTPNGYIYGSLEMLKDEQAHKIKNLTAFSDQHKTIWYVSRNEGKPIIPPAANWQQLQIIEQNDPGSDEPAYTAIEYQIPSGE